MSLPLAGAGLATPVAAFDYLTRWGVVEHWALDEASGSAIASINGAHNLTDNATVTSATGHVYALARQFTSANSEFLSLADTASVRVGDEPAWFWAWVYRDTAGVQQSILSKVAGAFGTDNYVMDVTAANIARFFIGTAGGYRVASATTFGALSASTWYGVMGYHSSALDVVGVSVNGSVFDTATTAAEAPSSNAEPFRIGRRHDAAPNYMNGRIGPVVFGKNPPGGLTADLLVEIRDRLFNSGSGRAYPF